MYSVFTTINIYWEIYNLYFLSSSLIGRVQRRWDFLLFVTLPLFLLASPRQTGIFLGIFPVTLLCQQMVAS